MALGRCGEVWKDGRGECDFRVISSTEDVWPTVSVVLRSVTEHFCSLVLFHFVPKGMMETVTPENWARVFGIPELVDR